MSTTQTPERMFDQLAALANEVMLASLLINPIPLAGPADNVWRDQERFIAAVGAMGSFLATHTKFDGRPERAHDA